MALQPSALQETDEHFMRLALNQARAAAKALEVPVGAVLVKEGQLLCQNRNRREEEADATAHAEMLVIKEGSKILGHWRLEGCTLYVTLEPCSMCAGAMVQARLERLVFGAPDPKSGAAGTLFDLVRHPKLNHRLSVTGGVLKEECAHLLQDFFRKRR